MTRNRFYLNMISSPIVGKYNPWSQNNYFPETNGLHSKYNNDF